MKRAGRFGVAGGRGDLFYGATGFRGGCGVTERVFKWKEFVGYGLQLGKSMRLGQLSAVFLLTASPTLADPPSIWQGHWVSQRSMVLTQPFGIEASVIESGVEVIVRDTSTLIGASQLDYIFQEEHLPVCIYIGTVDGTRVSIKAIDRTRSTGRNCPLMADMTVNTMSTPPTLDVTFNGVEQVLTLVSRLVPPPPNLRPALVSPDFLGIRMGINLNDARATLAQGGYTELGEAIDKYGNRIATFGRKPLAPGVTNVSPLSVAPLTYMDHVSLEISQDVLDEDAIVLAAGRELVFAADSRPTTEEMLTLLIETYGEGEVRRSGVARFTATFDENGEIGASDCRHDPVVFVDFRQIFDGYGIGAIGNASCPVEIDSYLESSDGRPLVDRMVYTIVDYPLLQTHRWKAFEIQVASRVLPFLEEPAPTGDLPDL